MTTHAPDHTDAPDQTEFPDQSAPDFSPAALDYLLTLADDEHMVGARHTAWIGLGPFLEEDLAFCSIAQDELGHAIALYTLITGDERTIDDLALRRPGADYRSSWLAEWPCDTWATALVRHWLYDRAENLRWRNVASSTITGLAALVPGIEREEAFHLRHAEQFLSRVCVEAWPEIEPALSELLAVAGSLWTPPIHEPDALAEGVAARSFAELGTEWRQLIEADLRRWGVGPERFTLPAGLALPGVDSPQNSRNERSPHFAALLEDLNAVASIDPTAVW